MTRVVPLLLLPALLSAQEKCSLSGAVVNFITGEPLNKAGLLLLPADRSNRTPAATTTDAEGRFAMVDLEPGSYLLTGTRNGYLETAYGAKRAHGQGVLLRLDAGQSLPDLKLKLIPFAVIAGTVRDSDGEPLHDVRVSMARLSYERGKPRAEMFDGAQTDDLGQYRISNLAPGKYYVSAKPGPDRPPTVDRSGGKAPAESPVPTAYPGASDLSLAAQVEVAMGARVTGIDIRIARVRTYTVRGRAVTALDAGAAGASIVLYARDRGSHMDLDLKTTTRNANGEFELRGVPAGRYRLAASRAGSGSVVVPLEVSSNVQGLTVELGKGAEVMARAAMEGGGAVNPGRWQILLTVDDRRGYFLNAEAEGIALQRDVIPDRYEVRVERPPAGTYVKSIRAGQTDVMSEGLNVAPGATVMLEILLAADAGKVAGTVAGKDELPAPGATVVLLPEPRLRTRFDLSKMTTTDQTGRFEFTTVPPGEYKVFAWDDVEPGIWYDPDFLKEHEKKGEPVTVPPKETATVKVKL